MIKLNPELLMILSEIGDEISMAIMEIDNNGNIDNKHGISEIGVSPKDWNFEVTIGKKVGDVKVGSILRDFFGNNFTQKQITDFTKSYNDVKNELFDFGFAHNSKSKAKLPPRTPIEVVARKANYKNVRETFLSFVTETYPHGHEEEVMHLMPSDLEKDMYGNYYKIIGNPDVMFTSHLDTASHKKSKVNLFTYKEGNDDIICTDNKTILGADDKAGVAVMLYMMEHNVPGV